MIDERQARMASMARNLHMLTTGLSVATVENARWPARILLLCTAANTHKETAQWTAYGLQGTRLHGKS